MDGINGTIFRAEALQYRLRNQARRGSSVSLPRSMSLPVFFVMWLALGLLAIGGAAMCFVSVTVPGTGLAVIANAGTHAESGVTVTALMPATYGSKIHPGASASVFLNGKTSAIGGTVDGDVSEPLDPPAIERALGLPASALAILDGPMVMVRVQVATDTHETLVPGTTGRAEMPVGTRPVGSFLPVVGHVFRSGS